MSGWELGSFRRGRLLEQMDDDNIVRPSSFDMRKPEKCALIKKSIGTKLEITMLICRESQTPYLVSSKISAIEKEQLTSSHTEGVKKHNSLECYAEIFSIEPKTGPDYRLITLDETRFQIMH